MAESQICALPKCERMIRGECDCCNQKLCLQHLSEHNKQLLSQLNLVTDQINILANRIQSFNNVTILDETYKRLENWRKNAYKTIDQFYETKRKELDDIVKKNIQIQQKEIGEIRVQAKKILDQQEVTKRQFDSLKQQTSELEAQMDIIEKMRIQLDTRSLIVDECLVNIKEKNEPKLDISNLKPPYRNLPHIAGSKLILANNDEYLLVHRKPDLCLVDKNMNIVKKVRCEIEEFVDSCWSSTLNEFIIIGKENVLRFNDTTMSFTKMDVVDTSRKYLSCTCSDSSLFLSTDEWGSSIIEYKLSPSIAIIKEWKSPVTCETDEVIHNICYNNKTCAIVIKNKVNNSIRMELRACETMNKVWCTSLNTISTKNLTFCCCWVTWNEWLVCDYERNRLLQISTDGVIKKDVKYDGKFFRACLFNWENLIISTPESLNFHKIY